MKNIEPVEVNGYDIYPFQNKDHFLDYLDSGNWNNILVALNAEKIMKVNDEFRQLVNKNIGYPDGIGAVVALKRMGNEVEKIAGAEFWLDILEAFHKEKTFYLIGAKPEVIEATVKKLRNQFPGVQLKGYCDGYFDEDEYKKIKKEIIQKNPDVVYVAMGSPKQEFIMQDLQKYHKALYMGLGGSFDVYTGAVKRAPKIWINLHLEWAYRLLKQPSRIFRQRVLVTYAYYLLTGKL